MAERINQSTAMRIGFQAYLANDHVSPATGKTIAILISKNGGAYANPSAGATNATAISDGSYYVDLSTTDTNTLGPLFLKGTEATIDTVIGLYTVAVISSVNQIADALLDRTDAIETGLTPRGALRLVASASAGKLSGAATTSVAIRNVGDTKDRITATVDASGNRTAITTDVT